MQHMMNGDAILVFAGYQIDSLVPLQDQARQLVQLVILVLRQLGEITMPGRYFHDLTNELW